MNGDTKKTFHIIRIIDPDIPDFMLHEQWAVTVQVNFLEDESYGYFRDYQSALLFTSQYIRENLT